MSGWAARHVGTVWPDCAALVTALVRERLGFDLDLPSAAGLSTHARARRIARMAPAVARPLGPGEAPADCDGVLMRETGRRGPGHHVGVMVVTGPRLMVLHARPNFPAALHPLGTLPQRGWECLGIWRWTT